MSINVATLAPASLKSKNVATEQYVDNSVATVNSSLASLAASEEARDGLIDTFYQTSAPTTGMSYGDYWVDTDDVSYTTYRYQNASTGYNTAPLTWCVSVSSTAKALQNAYKAEKAAAAASTAASAAQTTANSKVSTYYTTSAPSSNLVVGDLWVNSSNNTMYRWNGSSWVTITVDVSSQLPQTLNSTVAPNSSNVYPKGTIWRQSVTVNGGTQYTHWLSYGSGVWANIGGTYIDGSNIVTGSITANQVNLNNLFAQNITYTGVITGGNVAGGGLIKSYNGKMVINLVEGSIYIA